MQRNVNYFKKICTNQFNRYYYMCIIYINISSLNMTITINTLSEVFRPKTMCFYGCTILMEMFSPFLTLFYTRFSLLLLASLKIWTLISVSRFAPIIETLPVEYECFHEYLCHCYQSFDNIVFYDVTECSHYLSRLLLVSLQTALTENWARSQWVFPVYPCKNEGH